jgi:CheY-like chemotaxis protein
MVDDDPAICFTVREVLREYGVEVSIAESGEQCLQELHNGFRGVILMDVMMPEMDGWQTIERIAAEGLMDGNVICMLTAVSDPGPEMEHLKEYVLDYVRKPFSPSELFETVQQCLHFMPAA